MAPVEPADGRQLGERNILRIAHPSAKEPWMQSQWTMDGKAVDATIRDHRRLYTTATVFKALSEFKRRLSLGGAR